MSHYHVNTFIPGCLNDGSLGPFTNRREAERAATAEALDWRTDGWITTGSAKDGYTITDPHGHGLLRLLIEPCDEPSCFEEDEL